MPYDMKRDTDKPTQIIDVDNLQILAGAKGLKPGDELTVSVQPPPPPRLSPSRQNTTAHHNSQFYYPSTEWELAQPFDCTCGTPSCQGRISGAGDMTASQLDGYWLSGHIRELKRDQKERDEGRRRRRNTDGGGGGGGARPASNSEDVTAAAAADDNEDGPGTPPQHRGRRLRAPVSLDAGDPTVQALQQALDHAEKVVVAARTALVSYMDVSKSAGGGGGVGVVVGGRDGKGLDRMKHRGTFGEGGGPLRRNNQR